MSNFGDAFGEILASGSIRAKKPRPIGAVTGTVNTVSATTATVVLDGFDPTLFFGPMPFTRTSTPPKVGDQCLVMFTGSNENPSWLVGWQVKS